MEPKGPTQTSARVRFGIRPTADHRMPEQKNSSFTFQLEQKPCTWSEEPSFKHM